MHPGSIKRPDFIIIGAQKCGTSSLFYKLNEHPGILLPKSKELHFFDEHFSRGLDWYLSFFTQRRPAESFIAGEASPYYFFHPLVPVRIFQTFPGIKLVLLLRSPVDRAYSQYQHMKREGRIPLTFEHCINLESEILGGRKEAFFKDENHSDLLYRRFSFLARSRYAEQLTAWYACFSREQILIIRSEDFFSDPGKIFQVVFHFLGLPSHPVELTKKEKYPVYPPMKPETRQKLANYFEPCNRQLCELTGRDFGWT